MTARDGQEPGELATASEAERYGALQTGYREALLVQLDFAITELEEQGDFTPEQIEAAVRVRLEKGRDALRGNKLAEEWDWPRS